MFRHNSKQRVNPLACLIALFLMLPFSAQGALLNTADDAALVALYNATGGASWTNSTGWSGTAGVMVDGLGGGTAPFGVTVDAATGRVRQLTLSNNNLIGDISALDLSGLTELITLSFYVNQLTGTLPTATKLPTGILSLNLIGNQLTGAVPDYSACIALKQLSLEYNQLSGSLPAAAQLPSGIQYLVLNSNQLTGTIPDYSTRTNLISLGVGDNQLSGGVPTAAQLPSGIRVVNLYLNQLTGTIPDYSTLSLLIQLNISSNQLTGSLPAVAQLPAGIQALSLGYNQLFGAVPDYSVLGSLTSFDLRQMNIQGPTPNGLLAFAGTGYITTSPVIDPALDGKGRQSAIVTVTGTGAEVGGTVELLVDGVTTLTGITVDALGTWSTSLDLSASAEGTTHALTAISRFDNWPGYAAGQASTVVSSAVSVTMDNTAPVITLVGSASQSVEEGASYPDQGATVSDNFDSGLAATVTGSVDTSTPGTYTLTYNATDSAGNAAIPVERTVEVTATAASSGGGGGGGSLNMFVLLLMLLFLFAPGRWSVSANHNIDWRRQSN